MLFVFFILFFIEFIFNFTPWFFYWLGIWLRDFFGFVFHRFSLNLMTHNMDFED
jgi:hypothetical protein